VQRTLSYNNIDIVYHVTGNGAPVVLIHGFAEDNTIWKYQQAFLQQHFQLIIPDLPGSGQSPFLPFKNTSAIIDGYAAIIKKILDQENIKSCNVVGHSMGGYVALAFAEKFPEHLAGLGLFHSTAYEDTEEKKKSREKGIAFIQKFGSKEFLKQAIPNLFGENFKKEHPGNIDELIEASGNYTQQALVQYYEAMMARPNRIAVLKSTSKPVLFIIGEEDKSVYLQDSLSQCHLPGLSLIDILPNVAHMGMWEMKDRSNATLMSFLNYTLHGRL